MKPAILIPIIIGPVLLVSGGVILAVGIKNSKSPIPVTYNYTIEENFDKYEK